MLGSCFVCTVNPRAQGVLCASCLERFPEHPESFLSEHIFSRVLRPSGAFLVDRWGRPHTLGKHTVVGRDGAGLRILSGWVSREHLALSRSDEGWWVVDLGSRNGTAVNGRATKTGCFIRVGDRLDVSRISLLFAVGDPKFEESGSFVQTWPVSEYVVESQAFSLHEAPHGGGGMLRVDASILRLSFLQLQLVRLLAEQQRTGAGDKMVVGFATTAELLTSLPWDAKYPDERHLKQLVYRTRSRLDATPLSIESKRGLGYRLTGRETDS